MKIFHNLRQQINCDLSNGKNCWQCKFNMIGGLIILAAVAFFCDDFINGGWLKSKKQDC